MSIESTEKLLEYINRVSKVPLVVNGKPFVTQHPKWVTLRRSFYYKDSCLMCGKCCPNETTAWTKEGYYRVLNAENEEIKFAVLKKLEEITVDVNGKQASFWVYPKDERQDANKLSWPDRKEVERCHWLFEEDGLHKCAIHPIRSITCGMPHVRFAYVEKTRHTSIGTLQFGRNFRLKCPIEFNTPDEESIRTKMFWLNCLLKCADDLGVETFLPEIINYLEAGGRGEVTFNLLRSKKLF